MTHRHTLLVVSVAVAMLVAPTIMAQETATATDNATNQSETAGMGAQLTAFTQSSSSALNDSVENGMWKAGFNQSNASERARLVRDRAGTLEGRLARLQAQNESVRERYENGSLPQPAYIAQQSRLSARIDALRTAINDTDEAAAQAGVNDSRLERLRQNASTLTGPEVAAIARGLGGGPPADRGPPANRGPPADGGDRGPPEDPGEGGPPAEAGDRGQSANGTDGSDRGPPENRGQGGDSAGGGNSANGTTDDGSDAGSSPSGSDSTGGSEGAGGGSDAAGGNGGERDDAPGRSRN